jgi:hypothetical protein
VIRTRLRVYRGESQPLRDHYGIHPDHRDGNVDEVRQRAVIALRARLAARQPEHTGVKKTSGAIQGGL